MRAVTMSKQNNNVEFCFLAEPTDVNLGGKVHGEMVMKRIVKDFEEKLGWK